MSPTPSSAPLSPKIELMKKLWSTFQSIQQLSENLHTSCGPRDEQLPDLLTKYFADGKIGQWEMEASPGNDLLFLWWQLLTVKGQSEGTFPHRHLAKGSVFLMCLARQSEADLNTRLTQLCTLERSLKVGCLSESGRTWRRPLSDLNLTWTTPGQRLCVDFLCNRQEEFDEALQQSLKECQQYYPEAKVIQNATSTLEFANDELKIGLDTFRQTQTYSAHSKASVLIYSYVRYFELTYPLYNDLNKVLVERSHYKYPYYEEFLGLANDDEKGSTTEGELGSSHARSQVKLSQRQSNIYKQLHALW